MRHPLFHVVPDSHCRTNNLLAIGSPEYNRIRYRPDYYGRMPFWKKKLIEDMDQKARGHFKSTRTEAGNVYSPAANRLRNDLKDCIFANIHFKSKTLEYNASTYEFKVKGKYVATLDPVKGVIGHFSIQEIDDKYSRYRLRDLGIRLVTIKGKTFWKFGVERGYYDYLMAIHGSLDSLRSFFKPLFPSISIVGTDEDTEFDRARIVFRCELRKDIKYPVFPGVETFVQYGSNNHFAYASGIFHNYGGVFNEGESESMYRVQDSWKRFHSQIGKFEEWRSDRTDNFRALINIGLEDIGVISGILECSRGNGVLKTYSAEGAVSIYLESRVVAFAAEDGYSVERSFEELDIDRFFENRSLKFTPKNALEVSQLIEYKKAGVYSLKVRIKTDGEPIELDITDLFFNDPVVHEKLVGKEWLIG